MTDSATQETVRSRRAVLAAAAGSAAALAVTALRPGTVEAAPTNMQTETDNATIAPTGVTNSTAGSQALFGNAATDGNGVEGTSETGVGVRGISSDSSDPATNVSNAGVVGIAGDAGNIAANIALSGVYGYADGTTVENFFATGTWGDSGDVGVLGTGTFGVFGYAPVGVLGVPSVADGIGVHAASALPNALALRAAGRVEFTRSGRFVIKAGNNKRTVTLAGCTTSTIIFAVLASNESGRWVRAAVPGSGSFTVILNQSLASDGLVAWIAFTNPGNHSG